EMRRLASLSIVLLLCPRPTDAQTTAGGSVYGRARDESGAVLPGVAVSATSPTVPGIRTTTTDSSGAYRLADLPPGEYTLGAELSGFARFAWTPIVVRAGLNVEVNITMKVGSVAETVEVRQDAPLLETRNAAQAVNVSGELLRGIPLSERREWFGA